MKALSVNKFEESINEDAVIANENFIAVSDGAGGGGLFADKWSRYLVEHLPDEPIVDYQTFDKWIDGIWEPFYYEFEHKAQSEGGILLNKFYEEGSFATLAVAWKTGQWISYGDSVVFCYDKSTQILQHSFGRLIDFNNPPYLINCKDPTVEAGLKIGHFKINSDSMVFATTDTLAHYIIMMYESAHKDQFAHELQEAVEARTKNSNYVTMAMKLKHIDFEKDVLYKILNCNLGNLKRHLKDRMDKGLIGLDDYSFALRHNKS